MNRVTDFLVVKSKNWFNNFQSSPKKLDATEVVVPFPAPIAGRAKLFAKDAKILCDTMVQGLGKYLRKLGIDTKLLMNPVQHSYCVRVALTEDRFVITRGKSYQEARINLFVWYICLTRDISVC